jgi:Ca-activated chloride channel family protein
MIDFAVPAYLWLLVIPAALLVLWTYRLARRAIDLRRLEASRVSPLRERWSLLGDLPLWLSVVLACAALTLALARPRGGTAGLVRASLDIVVLQDGSASMYVQDVAGGTRWSRSMQFLRKLGDALRWEGDRVAMTVFARIATPEIRLTHDPTTVFFFLDHLGEHPPFRLDDETAWDTNLEEGIGWGLRVLKKDREILGPSRNAPAFLLISDGEAWSGEVARAVEQMRRAHVPLFVVGVGTVAGGRMPPLPFPGGEPPPTVSRLDRQGLRQIATEGDGEYYEIDQQPDRDIANRFIDTARRSVPPLLDPALQPRADEAAATDLYWPLIAAACGLVAIGALFARRPGVLWLELAGAAAALAVAVRILW